MVAASTRGGHLLGRPAGSRCLRVTWPAWDQEAESLVQSPRCRAAHLRQPPGNRYHSRPHAPAKELERFLVLSRNCNDLSIADNRAFILDSAKKSDPRRTRG